ncbi:hypothetical protein NUW58_g448 [Xylaria curta]|uniref:Uncharacterized protein n=1 Tax=Xylaria curta TaxID=42375 RepID=A0ACC1PRR7_9PEZI|nr:hypothetical protein NUW58_g448 [Xylaria curta]
MPLKTKKKGIEPSPELPGLFPTHDGSYGINTLITAQSKKGQKLSTGMTKEKFDDKEWVKFMKDKVSKKYGMNDNLKKAVDENHKEVEEEEHEGKNPSHHLGGNTQNPYNTPSSSSFEPPGFGNSGGPGSAGKPGVSGSIPPLTPHIPTYDPNNRPFLEQNDVRPRPPYAYAELPSANPIAHVGINHPISPPAEDALFYGLPKRQGGNEPISYRRPEPSNMYNFESGLFDDATLQTPGQASGLFGATQPMTQGVGLPAQNQTEVPSDLTNVPTTAGQPTNQPTSGSQPQPQSTLVWRPTPSDSQSSNGQPTSGSQPAPVSSVFWEPPQANPSDSEELLYTPTVTKTPKLGVTSKGTTKSKYPNINFPRQGTGVGKQKNPTKGGKYASRQRKWVLPSLDLITTSIIFFLVITYALWRTLPAISDGPDSGETSLPHTGLSSKFSKILGTISNLLPEIPDIQPIPNDHSPNAPSGPGTSGNNGINPDELASDLEQRMPDRIWVQGDKKGKMKIPEDFWRALRQLIMEDDRILSLENSEISEDHWLAIQSRIRHTNLGASSPTKDGEAFEEKVSQAWESWIEQNKAAVKKALDGVALTKDEFMKLFRKEITSYNREINQELKELQKRIEVITQQMSKFQHAISSTSGITKDEIAKTFDSLYAKVVNNAKLDATARGVIGGHINDVLANQVNFFGIGAGASIDPMFSSRSWKVRKDFFKSKKWVERDGYKAQPRTSALSPWNQEGECFCAGTDLKGYGQGTNNISVIISRNIVPQHLVVEHILPGATLDPGAIPKNIEVWASIEEVNLRDEVQAFSEAQFPGTPKEEILHEGFVKIGHFTYEKKNSGDGIQVFKLSDELTRMRAVTDHIVIRAINNYGADHTCFYRLRLYGEVVERPDDPPAKTQNRWSWL